MDATNISLPFAFLAGMVSFLSPCVLPLVPSYITFVSGLTMDELAQSGISGARRTAAIHSSLFILGFLLVFMTLGTSATAAGQAFNRLLPLISRLGGGVVILFGLILLEWVRLPTLAREIRPHLASKPSGAVGSLVVGIVFGAGWTPCIGPILATILLYATMEATIARGTALLAAYGLGLGVPFLIAALGFNWFLTRFERIRRWARPIQWTTGVLLIAVGILLVTGMFSSVSTSLADLGQWINLEL
ncbi:MAG: cytochrome c biogenesis protein CcdA [Gemmatimonadota bacterium]|nr:cytochrome c biogenesis protein CcdA [Gemmatimonadota bacterium]